MAANPQYASTPLIGIATISTANTALNGTGVAPTVLTAGSAGSRIDSIEVQATGATTAGMVRFFIDNGTTSYLIAEVPVVACTPSASVPAFSTTITASGVSSVMPLPLVIPSGYSLKASTEKSESFNIIAFGGSF